MRVFSNGPSGKLGAAILPVPAQMGEAYQSWGPIVGMPGTDLIPAPYPAAVPQGVEYVSSDPTSTSKDAPPVWRPGIYYQPVLAATPPMAVYSDNQMPVPAINPTRKISQQLGRPVFLRQNQVGQPVNLPKYAWRR
jgi:hypothetical protein